MTQVPFYPRSCLALAASALGLILAVAGCGTASHQPPPGDAPVERPIAMKGTDKFFGGEIEAVLTVTRGFGHGHGSGGKGGADEEPNLSEIFSSELNSDSDNKNYEEIYAKMRALQVRGSPLPPVILRLILNNHGPAPVDVEIVEVNSDLGNFAVRPDQLNLVPEKAIQPDPMTSLLGVTSDEIPVKVGLRVNGKTESKILLVKSVFTPDGKKK
jgi:hypothetical protein